MKRSLPYFITLCVIFIITVLVAFVTRVPFANAFFNNTKGLVLSFCAFMVFDIVEWLTHTTVEGAEKRTKGQELGSTIGVEVFMLYFLWNTWREYSLWQVCLTVAVCVLLGIGFFVRLYGKWDVDCVRWSVWSFCCFSVTMCMVGSILIWKPMTVMEAERLTIASNDPSFVFRYIDPSKSVKTPLGYYIFNEKHLDGSWGSYGTGRAVVYLGEYQENWRSITKPE